MLPISLESEVKNSSSSERLYQVLQSQKECGQLKSKFLRLLH